VTAEDAGIHAAATEAEQKQKLWRWLVIAAVIFLMVETAVAAKLSAAQRNSEVTP
jgi:ABC-type arginine transport system permease subunit